MGNQIRVHLFIAGRVQGVLFRQSARAKALELGLLGWAHNLLDGTVEIVCEGDERRVEEFVEWCKKGPPRANVERIEISSQDYTGEFKDFMVREFGF